MKVRAIVGAGAQGRVTLEVWRAAEPTASFVFLDDKLKGTRVLDVEVAGGVDRAGEFDEVVIALGHNVRRLELAGRMQGVCWGTVIHPSAVVMPTARIGAGAVVFAGAFVGTEASIGEHAIVNTGVIVEHDAVIARGASLSPGTRSGGRIRVGEGAFVATGVTLAPRVSVGAWSVVGAGAVVVRDVPERTLVYGVPARVVGAVDDAFDWQRLL